MNKLLRNLMWTALLLLSAKMVFAQNPNFNLQFRASLEYPGQTLANICGYAQGGREYALLGASNGMIVVDVTDPGNPTNIVQIPAPEGDPNSGSLWKEIKVYDHYAYLVTEAGGGVQIIDLSTLPNANLNYHSYTGDGAIAGQLNKIHALHVDAEKGFLYLYGGGLFNGGAKVLDLNADPYNPTYAGKFDALGYIHDGYAYNDTLYACHINAGLLSIVDMSNKSNPQLLGTVQTPGKFTHNSWLLDDRKHILTTDETEPSFLTAYDISDPQDIKELDRSSTNDGNNSIGHNTHVLNDWAVTSWYTDGIVVTDAHRPDNLVITALYDTWPGTGPDFDGCWGVYPYLPSGTIVASNIPSAGSGGGAGKLFVLTPAYVRACYLEGKVTSGCSDEPLIGATVEVNSNDPWINTVTGNDGSFKTGQAASGNFIVTISKTGYQSKTLNISLAPGQVTELDITLEPSDLVDITGVILTEGTLEPVADATVNLTGPDGTYAVQTDGNGEFELDCVPGGNYSVSAGAWGYFTNGTFVDELSIAAGNVITINLTPGYYDDFKIDLGWTNSATAISGLWERGEPDGTTSQGNFVNPEFDADADGNEECYVTGNGGGQAGNDDVDDGAVTLTSPPMKLAAYDDAVLTFWYWFFNAGGQGTPPNDQLEVRVSNGVQTVTIMTETISESEWRFSGPIHLKEYITLTDDVQVEFIAADLDPGHFVEAAVDVFSVVPEGVSSTSETDDSALITISPNPTASAFNLRYDWPGMENPSLEVRNLLGQVVLTQHLSSSSGTARFGNGWPKGVYIATLRSEGRRSTPVRMVKQ